MTIPGTESTKPAEPGSNEQTKDDVISKAEHEKALTESTQKVQTLTADIDKLKMQLLDPNYLEYLKQREETSEGAKTPVKPSEPIDVTTAVKRLENELSRQRQITEAILADIELKQVVETNKDFEDYRTDVAKILETATTDLTISQALAIARDNRRRATENPSTPAKPKNTFSEKPNKSIPSGSMNEKKTFKTDAEAGQDAWNQVKDKYGLTSDIL